MARADGYHAAAVAARNLQEWENRVASSLGLERVTETDTPFSGEVKAGGDLRSLGNATKTNYRRTGRVVGHLQDAQMNELVGVLAWMNRENIIPREFPDFDLEKIPDFRETAKNMLAALGGDVVERLIQNLAAPPEPPPSGRDMKCVSDFERDIVDVLGRIGRVEPLEGTSARDAEKAIEAIFHSGVPRATQEAAVQTVISALSTRELKKLQTSKSMVRQARHDELWQRCLNGEEFALGRLELIPALKELILKKPAEFIRFRQQSPWAAETCAEALAKTPNASLKRLYDKDRDPAALALLLEKPDALEEMGPEDLDIQKIREAMIAAAENGEASPGTAAMLVEWRKPTVDDLKRLVSSGKSWEKLGAFHLLSRKLPQTEESATWLLKQFGRLPADAQSVMRGRVGQRVEQASTEALVGALASQQAGLHQKVVDTLVERSRSTGRHKELRRHQDALVRRFAQDRPGNRALIPLLVNLKTKTTLTALIDALTDADATVWQKCRNELCKTHPGGMSYGPPNSADQAARAAAQQKWRRWLAGYSAPP